MFDLKYAETICSALNDAFMTSQIFSMNTEIVDGGTKNRIWSFVSSTILMNFTLSPLQRMYPDDLTLWLSRALMLMSGAACYMASIAQENQIHINQNEPEKIIALPFDLHEYTFLMECALWYSLYQPSVLIALYFALLGALFFMGSPLYSGVSLLMYGINLLNQWDYFPEYLKEPYYFSIYVVMFCSSFFNASWFMVALGLGFWGYTLYDYITCFLGHDRSATQQFPMATREGHFHLPDHAPLNDVIAHHRRSTRLCTFGVTFDHFYRSEEISARLVEQVAPCDFQTFIRAFEGIDFSPLSIQNDVLNEMVLHDKFQGLDKNELKQTLQISPESSDVDLAIAFLKREMHTFVARLEHPSYRDLNHQQMMRLLGSASLLCHHMVNVSSTERRHLLLAIAIQTGSHCNRMYLEALTNLIAEFNLSRFIPELSLDEQILLQIQTAREAAFRHYYYHVLPQLKAVDPFVNLLFADLDDYHSYEKFVKIYGGNFYLRNTSLNRRVRSMIDVGADLFISFLHGDELLFSEHYTVDYLIKQIMNPTGKLHASFIQWCTDRYPDSYQQILYDDCFFFKNTGEVKALAEIMLLDLNVIELTTPYPAYTPRTLFAFYTPENASAARQENPAAYAGPARFSKL